MNNMQQLIDFFGWMTAVNVGLLILFSLLLGLMKDSISAIHGKMFSVSEDELKTIYIKYLANYKILILVFNLVPYIALKIMAQ
ncbi:MAG: hypothetical protein ACI9JR_002726 [Gammaproteobacteria bacterium]|jgi:hypothetical protein